MAIMRFSKGKKNPYFQVHNSTINDTRLSWQAKGLLCYLISKPDHWYVNYHDLISCSTNGIKSVRSILKELIESCYLFRSQLRRNDGKFSYYDFTVYEIPQKPKYIKNKLPPHSRKRHAATTHAVNDTLVITDKNESTDKTTTTPSNIHNIKHNSVVALSSFNKINMTVTLLDELKIKNHNKLFDLFDLSDIFKYATWIKSNNPKMKNPTGFLISAIREKWMDFEPSPDTPGLLIFFQLCSVCNKHFAYEEYEPKFTECLKCRNKL